MTVSSPLAQGLPSQEPVWHMLSVEEAVGYQHVSVAEGLTQAEVNARLQHFGSNTLAAASKEPGWRAFLRQYQDPMQLVFWNGSWLALSLSCISCVS